MLADGGGGGGAGGAEVCAIVKSAVDVLETPAIVSDAEIVALPAEMPVTRPEALTLATPDALELNAEDGAP